MTTCSLPTARRAHTRSATARLAARSGWMEGAPQQPIDLLMRTDKMAAVKTSYAPSNLSGITMLWPQELKDEITSCGLHGMMSIRPMNYVDRQHGLWLLNNLEPATLSMRFVDGAERKLDRTACVQILGLNGGDREVPIVNPIERDVLVSRVLRLIGEDAKKPGGLTVKMLKEFLEKPPPLDLTPAYKTKVRVCYTLLSITSFLAPRYATQTVSEEAMYIVLNPAEIGEYDLASYTLQVLREMAHRARVDQEQGSMTILAGGCYGLLEVFSFDWLNIAELEASRHISPRIAASNGNLLRELIKKECFETGEGKIYGRARTRPLRRPVSPLFGEGSSSQASAQMPHVDRNLLSGGNIPTVQEFVSMVMADQSSRVSALFERVCHEYRMIDDQVGADRKRRRNEVNIAAGAIDFELGRELGTKYKGIVDKILASNGMISLNGATGAGNGDHGVDPTAPHASPAQGCEPQADGMDFIMGREMPGHFSTPFQQSVRVGGEGGSSTTATAAEILQAMASSTDYKGKSVVDEGPSKSTKLPIRRCPGNTGVGFVIRDSMVGSRSGSSGATMSRLPVWDVSGGYSGGINAGVQQDDIILPGEVEMQMMYASDAAAAAHVFPLHPSILGLSHIPYPSHCVDSFFDSVTYLRDVELQRKWYVSTDREEFGWNIVLTGKDIKDQMMDETEIDYHTMAASNRDSNLRDRVMYCNEEHPWGALVEPNWAIHFLYDPAGTSEAYIKELMSPRRIGYNISNSSMVMATVRLRDSWSLYGFDLQEKVVNVLDPLYQGASDEAYLSKHGDSTKCLLTGLRRCGQHHGYGWNVVEEDWSVVYHNALHPRCSHENTGVYVFVYATKFNGLTVPGLEGGLTPRKVSHYRRQMLYEVNASRANYGEIPGYLLHSSL